MFNMIQVKNAWILQLLQELESTGSLRKLSREGFIQEGRGAVCASIEDNQCNVSYLSKSHWQLASIKEPRLISLLETIDNYQPLTQTIIVVLSEVGETSLNITVCLLK